MEVPPLPLNIFRVSLEERASCYILHVRGEVDFATAPSFRGHLMRLVGRGRSIIVDCSNLQYLDMKGIRVLEECHRRATERGERLVLVGSDPLVHNILTIVQLNQRIPTLDTLDEALTVLGEEGTR
jgi:anti-anti-sigma factor